MFILQGEGQTNKGPQPPAPDAPLLELVAYNVERLKAKYLGTSDKERATNIKLAMNVSSFLGASACIYQFGDKFAV